jgi:formamidopyrimidine-DNA glycosylase
MPELPEVETTRRGVAPHVEGRTIRQVLVRDSRLRWPIPDSFGQALTGRSVLRVDRRAKYLLFVLDHGTLMLHLGMSGSLRVVAPETPVGKHDHVDLIFDDHVLRFRDPRRFGSMFYIEANPEMHPLLAELGPEPLSEDFSGDVLFTRSRGRKVAVKPFLMDAHIVVGVGNIYANEALFGSGIRPTTPAGKVSRARYRRLAEQIRTVLADAIEAGGTTLRDFVREDGRPGYFVSQLGVYGRGGEPCLRCGRALKEIALGQRTTVYCTRCQR